MKMLSLRWVCLLSVDTPDSDDRYLYTSSSPSTTWSMCTIQLWVLHAMSVCIIIIIIIINALNRIVWTILSRHDFLVDVANSIQAGDSSRSRRSTTSSSSSSTSSSSTSSTRYSRCYRCMHCCVHWILAFDENCNVPYESGVAAAVAAIDLARARKLNRKRKRKQQLLSYSLTYTYRLLLLLLDRNERVCTYLYHNSLGVREMRNRNVRVGGLRVYIILTAANMHSMKSHYIRFCG